MTTPPPPPRPSEKRWGWGPVTLIAIFVVPLLIVGVMVISWASHALFGQVNIFNVSVHVAPASQVAGTYRVRSKDLDDLPRQGIYLSDRSGLRLGEDHTLDVMDFPAFDKDGSPRSCHYNGKGTWALVQNGASVALKLSMDTPVPPEQGDLPSCGLINPPDLKMLGHSPPFRFWYESEPGSYSGLMYERR